MLFRLQRFPKKICSHRLVENVPVAERAMDIWPNIEKFVEAAKLGNIKLPKNKSVKVVADSMVDNLFFGTVACIPVCCKAGNTIPHSLPNRFANGSFSVQ